MALPPRLSEKQKYLLYTIYNDTRVYRSLLLQAMISKMYTSRTANTVRASVGRSVRKLSERGLVVEVGRAHQVSENQATLPIPSISERIERYWVLLTDRGTEVAEEITRHVNDGRYDLSS